MDKLLRITTEEQELNTIDGEEDENRKLSSVLRESLAALQERARVSRSYSFSSPGPKHPSVQQDEYGVIGVKKPRPALKNASVQVWNEDLLFRHLVFVEGTVPMTNEGAIRLLVCPYLFRARELNSDLVTILSVEQEVPSVTVRGQSYDQETECIDWVSVVTSRKVAVDSILTAKAPGLDKGRSTLLVMEANGPNHLLQNYLRQAVEGMYAYMSAAKKNAARGVLTNGKDWIFIIVKVNNVGSATFCQSRLIGTHVYDPSTYTEVLSRDAVCFVSSIIAHWMTRGNEELDDDDYFTYDA